ncbi:urea amidolyase associated protein UAAP1 [Cobetia amphilecti]|uniref:urea amidolyase associated protein UAAP1 n=1 Tax=Cobetia amphilecti TaxID=1055104 RepID=UPI0026E3E128|nr:urea amidolyase associated protein UAAP1 [Cobetia amphilecti]MDO6814264.1 DUF1989 domain-containing protein [Cobetia amphilecti]
MNIPLDAATTASASFTASFTAKYKTHLPGGHHWSMRMPRGSALKLTASEANANVGLVMYNPLDTLERLNLPDTLKGQHTFRLTEGHCLYSDMGRIFASIIQDDLGWHDSASGNLMEHHFAAKGWHKKAYQQAFNDFTPSGHDSLLIEMAKYGLSERDLCANLNLFSRVRADEDANLHYVADHCAAGDSVTLRFEMDTLVMLHTCPHPLDPAEDYPLRGVDMTFGTATPMDEHDACYLSRPENARAYANNQLYHLAG